MSLKYEPASVRNESSDVEAFLICGVLSHKWRLNSSAWQESASKAAILAVPPKGASDLVSLPLYIYIYIYIHIYIYVYVYIHIYI